MELDSDDVSSIEVVDILKNLKKVSAPKDFETTLWRKINSVNYEPQFKEEKWWEKYLVPQRLIPASASVLALIILLSLFTISNSDAENPLIATPKLRNDVKNVVVENVTPEVKTIPKAEAKINKKQSIVSPKENAEASVEDNNGPGQLYTSSSTTENDGFSTASFSGSLNKSGYNYLQVKLTDSERERVNKLRERIRSYFNRQNR